MPGRCACSAALRCATERPAVADVTAAAAHLAQRRARQHACEAEHPDARNPIEVAATTDWAGHAWRRSRHDAAQARKQRAGREAERAAQANQSPPF